MTPEEITGGLSGAIGRKLWPLTYERIPAKTGGPMIGKASGLPKMIPPAKDAPQGSADPLPSIGRGSLRLAERSSRLARAWRDGRSAEVVEALRDLDPLEAASIAAGISAQLGEQGKDLAAYLGAVWTVTR